MIQLRNYHQLPAIVNGYPLDDRISVIVPVARTNLVQNPSFEVATTSWTAIGGSIARSTTYQYHGAYSLAVTPTATTTDGVRYDTVSLTSGTTYAYSCKVLGVAGKSYKIAIETTGGVELSSITFTASGRWQWVYGYWTETATTTRRLTVRKAGGAETSIFYVDGAQVEAVETGNTVSTYIDGSQQGLVPNQNPPAYYWTGTPHASTSVRSGLTRAGGMVVKFSSFGFFLTALIGLGLATPQNVAVEYARIDGGYDDYTRKPSRQFTIQGIFESKGDYLSLRQQRGGLARLLDRDLVAQDQRLVLLRDVVDECGQLAASTCRLLGKYQGGLEGNTDNHLASQAPITFTQYLSVVLSDGESGAALNVQTSVSASAIVKRDANGVYSALGSGAAATSLSITDIGIAPNGYVYVTGMSTNIGGVAAADMVAYWDGAAWNAMATGLAAGGWGYAIAFDASGQVYVGGSFTDASGVANTANLARWTGSAWQSITPSGSANFPIRTLAFDSQGNLYAGGSFTSINGVAANRIAKMTPAGTWTALGGGLDSTCLTIITDAADNVYAGGTFTVTATRVAKWNGASWSALGSGLDADVVKLVFAPNNLLYAAGSFANSGSVAMAGAAAFNGVTWQPLGSGLTGGIVTEVVALPDGTLVYGGWYTAAGGITLPDGISRWIGGSWTYLDADLPGTSHINALARSINGDLYIGYETSGSVISAGLTTITNPGTARSYPTVTINGPATGTARIYSIANLTANRTIYLNYTIQAGETATFIFQPDNLSFQSNVQGDLAHTIQPGSNTALIDVKLPPA